MARLANTLQTKYGEDVSHPMHIEAVRDKVRATNLERFGAENPFSKGSTLYSKVREASDASHVVLTGADNPFSWPEVQEKIRQTNRARYGAENPSQNTQVRAKTQATNLERYGSEEMLASPHIREKIATTNQDRYGGPAPANSPQVVERARQTNLERWGVDWTGQSPFLRRVQLETMVANYGNHFFASEIGKQRLREIFIREYGVPHPMMVPEIAYKALISAGGKRQMNLLERRFSSLNSELLYTGNGSFWRWLSKLGHHKNPDFILPGPDPKHPKKGVTKVVEVFGDFWHSRMFTGRANFDHESELVEAYKEAGFDCLVVWESAFNNDSDGVRAEVQRFLTCAAT